MSPSQQLTIEQAVSLAEKAADQGDIAVARQLYSAVLQQQPNHPVATKSLGQLPKELPHNQSLQAQTVNPSPNQCNALINLYHSGQITKTEQACKELMQAYPQSLIVLNVLGATLVGQGQLQPAVQVFDKVVQLKPDYAEAYSNRGNALKGLGQLEAAAADYDKAIQLMLDYAEAYSNRGNALTELGQPEAAVADYDKATQLKLDLAKTYINRGNTLRDLGQLEAAVDSYDLAIKLKPDYAEAYSNRGNALTELGQLETAVESYDKAIQLRSDYAQAYSNRGNALRDLGQLEAAVESYDKAIQLRSDYVETYSNRGVALAELGQLEAAVDSYNQAIELQPDYAEAYINRGNALRDLGQLEAAVESYDKAIQLRSDYVETYSNRGVALAELGQLEAAVDSYNQAIELQPDYAEAYYNRGNTLRDLGQLAKAVESYNRAIEFQPDFAEAHWNLSLALLLLGDLRNGWQEYEYRKLVKKGKRRVVLAPYPLWEGEPLVDKVILVTAEQGVGDEVMFASCIPDLINLHPKQIILECDLRLAPLFARSFQQVDVQGKDRKNVDWLKELGDIDFQIAIGSLPVFFRQQLSDFPASRSFLVSNTVLRDKWRRRYDDLGPRMKIGISWTGGVKDSRKRAKAPTLEQWLPLLRMDACFINLQYGDHRQELEQLKESSGVHIHHWADADPLTDLDNQAAQIAELDLVISFNNATVQIAGAIGKKTWVLVSIPPRWMYMLDRSNSPWYPATKLFRQTESGGWVGVIEDVRDNLLREIHKY